MLNDLASPHDGRAVTELSRRSLAKPARDSTNNSHAVSAPTTATIGRVDTRRTRSPRCIWRCALRRATHHCKDISLGKPASDCLMELARSMGTIIPKAALPAGFRNKLGRTESGDLQPTVRKLRAVSDGGRERPNRKDLDAAPTEQAGSNKRASKELHETSQGKTFLASETAKQAPASAPGITTQHHHWHHKRLTLKVLRRMGFSAGVRGGPGCC